MSLKEPASWPVSSLESTGTRAERSPSATRRVPSRRSSIGSRIERSSRSDSSSEIVKATAIATSTPTPSARTLGWSVERPATTTPVITLSAGSPSSRRRRSGIVVSPSEAPSGTWIATSSITGRRISSIAKNRRNAL